MFLYKRHAFNVKVCNGAYVHFPRQLLPLNVKTPWKNLKKIKSEYHLAKVKAGQ